MGVLYDKYDEESGGPVYGENNVRVVTPCDFLSPAERRELSGPVKTYKLKVGCIEDCPTIDAVPVVCGKWKRGREFSSYPRVPFIGDAYYCSNCEEEAYWDTDYGQQLFGFCPNCGAKMEVEP